MPIRPRSRPRKTADFLVWRGRRLGLDDATILRMAVAGRQAAVERWCDCPWTQERIMLGYRLAMERALRPRWRHRA
jgi:hypothetical protein